jgi:hypothetical protein
MNLCSFPRRVQVGTLEQHDNILLQLASDSFDRPSRLLGLERILGAVLFVVALTLTAPGQSSVSLAWNPDAGTNIGGYKIYYGAASRTYANVNNVGNVTNATVSGLVSGKVYYFAATAYDTSGAESDYSAEVVYTNPVAAAPTIVMSSPANGAGFTVPASITCAASVTANGHTITQVQFYNGTTLLGTVAAAPYTYSWNNVSAGSYSLSAKAVYDSGSTVTCTPVTVSVANTVLPSIALTAPANGATYTAPASVTCAASVTPNGHTITQVQFYNGTTLLGTVAAAPYSFSWNTVSASTYSLSAKAVYDSGSTVASATANVTVTNVPLPSIVLTAPVNGTSYAAPATISLAATVTANGHTITKVQFYNGATLLGAVAAAPYIFSWTNVLTGSFSLTAQVVYDTGSTASSAPVNVNCFNATSVVTIWPATAVPGTVDAGPDSAVELGVKFRSDVPGSISGIRFYKATANTGTHSGHLWSSAGTLLASATFTGESASGWQQVNFATPVAIASNTVYVASYYAAVGHYSLNGSYFASKGVDNPPLHALTNGVSGGNGVYAYSTSSAFPNQTYNAANYWVDVVFQPGAALTLTSIAVTPANPTILVGATQQFAATGTYSDGSTMNLTSQATWSSSSATTVSVSASGLATAVSAGTATLSAALAGVKGSTTLTVTAPATLSSIAVTPANPNLLAGAAQQITATGTYSDGSTKNVTSQASWTSSNTTVATMNASGLATALSAGSTTIKAALAGVTGSTLLTVQAQAVAITTTSLPNGVANAAYSATLTASGGTPPYTWSIASGALPTGLALNATSGAITGTPTTAGAFSFTAQATDAGSPVQSVSKPLSITVVSVAAAVSIWPTTAVPGTADGGADSPVELGVKLRSDVAGSITGVRFYKASANTGTHVGHLWSSSGTLLASATFVGETASGWQQVNFATPVAIAANTVYVASYHATVGHYSCDTGYFSSKGVNNPPLHALTNGISGGNGVYAYTSSSAFPNLSWNTANYWVDVAFLPGSSLPAPWQSMDTGSVGLAGSAVQTGALWNVNGAGTLSGTADAFQFLYQPMSADAEIRAQLNSVSNTSTNARVGVMIRETLTPGSRYAFMGILPSGTFRAQSRSSTSGTTASTVSSGGTLPNVWARLVRTGNSLYSYQSTTGTNWTLVTSNSITMATNIYFGLAVASGSTNTLNTSTFTNLTVVP